MLYYFEIIKQNTCYVPVHTQNKIKIQWRISFLMIQHPECNIDIVLLTAPAGLTDRTGPDMAEGPLRLQPIMEDVLICNALLLLRLLLALHDPKKSGSLYFHFVLQLN